MSISSRSILDGVILPDSALYQGRFGRIYRGLPAWNPPRSNTDPINIPDAVVEERFRNFANDHMSEDDADQLDNTNIPAGYTYFGQFVDHDITFDPTSSLIRANDPNKLNNFRTPRLDLDCIYGEGPSDEPFMYDNRRKGMFLLGVVQKDKDANPITNSSEPDLLRNIQGRAIIGDMRNDENVIVSQLQLSMLRLHNRILATLLFNNADMEDTPEEFDFDPIAFQEAQRITRWFYQYVVWNDFVRRIIKDSFWTDFLKKVNGVYQLNTRFYRWEETPFMPIEFSVAAYRFGHSLVRPGYQVNLNTDVGLGFNVERPIFARSVDETHDLHGFRFFPHKHTVQWDWFFEFISSGGPFPQPSRRIDPKLSSSVFRVPEGPNAPNHLAFLNILRSWRFSLPTGTSVAKHMGFKPHAIDDEHENILWHYILEESRRMVANNSGRMLGNVGGTIVGEVFAGLLFGDKSSYIRIDANWTPAQESTLQTIFEFERQRVGGSIETPELGGDWQVCDLLRAAGAPINDDDVANTISMGFN